MTSTAEMIKKIKRGAFPDAEPLMLCSIFALAKMEEALHEAGIPWRSVAEGVSPDANYAVTEHYGMYRRWVLLVRNSDLEAAVNVAKTENIGFEAENLPVKLVAGRLCGAYHGYELEPCTHCCTGWDWLAKSDEYEKLSAPERRPSPL